MLKITILSVGKIKEKFYTEAIKEYSKRLGAYVKLDIVEVKDVSTKEHCSEAEKQLVLSKEKENLLARLPKDSYCIALDIKGESMCSEEFAGFFAKQMDSGVSHICLIIGGSLGLSEEILSVCKKKISFSAMTFPHQLMRVILLEQIYRAFRIINNQPYHK